MGITPTINEVGYSSQGILGNVLLGNGFGSSQRLASDTHQSRVLPKPLFQKDRWHQQQVFLTMTGSMHSAQATSHLSTRNP